MDRNRIIGAAKQIKGAIKDALRRFVGNAKL